MIKLRKLRAKKALYPMFCKMLFITQTKLPDLPLFENKSDKKFCPHGRQRFYLYVLTVIYFKDIFFSTKRFV